MPADQQQQQPQQMSPFAQLCMTEMLKNLQEARANPGALEAKQAAEEQARAAGRQYPYAPQPLPALNPDGGLAGDQQQGQT